MNQFLRFSFTLLFVSMIIGCQPTEDDDHVLRVHDVSGLQQRDLDDRLNNLLDREDLALKGRVTLIEQDRLAVNGPEFLQQQIAGILDELRRSESDSALDNTTYRVRYWILNMHRGEQEETLPGPLSSIAPSLSAEFPGHAFSVTDFMESYHFGASRNQNLVSGAGSRARLYRAQPTSEGLKTNFIFNAPTIGEASQVPQYEVNRLLIDGQPIVLGRTFGLDASGQPVYQLLLAQADLTESRD